MHVMDLTFQSQQLQHPRIHTSYTNSLNPAKSYTLQMFGLGGPCATNPGKKVIYSQSLLLLLQFLEATSGNLGYNHFQS